jgi:hypothetical protein
VAKQRGPDLFEKSFSALKKLNTAGYGTTLPLNQVYNLLGPQLPGPQADLEADYKEALGSEFSIVFNRLFTITNQPIARFAEDLRLQGKTQEYMSLLANGFNPVTVPGPAVSRDAERRLDGRDLRLRLQPDAQHADPQRQPVVPLRHHAEVPGELRRPNR